MQYPQNRLIDPLAAALEHRQGNLTHPAELPTAVSVNPAWVEMLGTYWPYLALGLWVVTSVVLIGWLTSEARLVRVAADSGEILLNPSSPSSRGTLHSALELPRFQTYSSAALPVWLAPVQANLEGRAPSYDASFASESLLAPLGHVPDVCVARDASPTEDVGPSGDSSCSSEF